MTLAYSRRGLLGLLGLALLPRLALALIFLRYPIGLDDMFQYDMLARSLASGKGFRWYSREDVERMRPHLETVFGIELPVEQVPVEGYLTVHRAPGYPVLLSALYVLVGFENRIAAARLFQVFLGASLAPLTALLACELGLAAPAARRAGVIVAVYPILWMYPLGLASENLFIPLVLAGVIVSLRAIDGRRLGIAVAAGFLLGAATLTRGVLAAFLPLAGLLFLRRTGLRNALGMLLPAALVVLPWIVRNSLILGRPAFVENSLGYNLFIGYHPEGDGGFFSEAAVIPLHILDDGERERWSMGQALGFIRDDPAGAAARVVRRLGFLWGLEDRELLYFYSNDFFGRIPQPWLLMAYLVLVSPLILIGSSAPFGMALTPRGRDLILGLFVASHLAYLSILAEPRFHLPLVPYLAVYAAAAWSRRRSATFLWQGLRRLDPRWVLAAGAALVLLVLWTWDLWREWPALISIMGPEGNALRLAY
ncbi:MAG TPA: hypothetical protein VJ123_04500 [Anaerolineales bacterium]|nr:hypothetical protein [Anaerolineales bacterium]